MSSITPNFFKSASGRDTVALLGAGALGMAIGKRLLQVGFTVRVYNRTFHKTTALVKAGASAFPTAREAVNGADLILSVVTDSSALQSVLFDVDGALEERNTPKILIDIGTHLPEAIISVANQLEGRGVSFVESPVTGSVNDALHGTLGFLVGGDVSTIKRVRPFLEMVGQNVYHMGAIGSGNTTKLALNLLVGAMVFGLRESVAMLNAAHLDLVKFLEALGNSGLKSPLYERIGQRYLQNDFTAKFSLANLEKDILLARDLAINFHVHPLLSTPMAAALRCTPSDQKQKDYSSLIGLINNQP